MATICPRGNDGGMYADGICRSSCMNWQSSGNGHEGTAPGNSWTLITQGKFGSTTDRCFFLAGAFWQQPQSLAQVHAAVAFGAGAGLVQQQAGAFGAHAQALASDAAGLAQQQSGL